MREIKAVIADIEKQLKLKVDEISIVSLVDLIVEYAYITKASDVHVHPEKDGVRLRVRVDGVLLDVIDPKKVTKEIHGELIARIKVMSGLRTDEHLAPQDGRFRSEIKDFGGVDVRVSIIPTYHGENAVLRVLAETQSFNLESLGLSPENLTRVKKAISKPYGMILANGPTGSGKTTTLYTILKQLNKPDLSIVSIEDPTEYSLEGITQIQVNNATGLSFANGLRSILRQDPNIIMVGEIRDTETAGIAVNAALTGHLVLSTLHTNDSAATFPRLIDMDVPPFLVASTVNVAMGQRLVRRVCEKCKKPRVLTKEESKSLSELVPNLDQFGKKFMRGEGCDVCNKTGFEGRVGIREALEVTTEIRDLIMKRATAQEIRVLAVKQGMKTMLDDGFEKAAAGMTTIEEVLRIIHE